MNFFILSFFISPLNPQHFIHFTVKYVSKSVILYIKKDKNEKKKITPLSVQVGDGMGAGFCGLGMEAGICSRRREGREGWV